MAQVSEDLQVLRVQNMLDRTASQASRTGRNERYVKEKTCLKFLLCGSISLGACSGLMLQTCTCAVQTHTRYDHVQNPTFHCIPVYF